MPRSIPKDSPQVSRSLAQAFRLSRHHLAKRASRRDVVRVVQDVIGVQAQLMSAAQLSLRARIADLTSEDLDFLLWERRVLVKAWCMRGALHLLAAEDLPVVVAGVGPNSQWGAETWLARSGLPRDEAGRILGVIVDVLKSGPLTRRELAAGVAQSVGMSARRWVEHSWGGVVKLACYRGLVCFGPGKGANTTYVLRDRWLSGWKDIAPEAAGPELVRRYLRMAGPASPSDLAAWAGIPVREVRAMWERASRGLTEVVLDGRVAWLLREDLDALRQMKLASPTVNLLPVFDTYLLLHKDKSHIVDAAHYKRVYRKAGWLSPVVLVDGRATGVWSSRKAGKWLEVRIEPFVSMPREVKRAVVAEADDIARFVGAQDARVVFT